MTGASDREKPRKAPVQARSRATYEAILEAAARILEAEGLAGVTTNRVAERAGVGVVWAVPRAQPASRTSSEAATAIGRDMERTRMEGR